MAHDKDWRVLRDLPYTRKPTTWSEVEDYTPTDRELDAISRLQMLETYGTPSTDLFVNAKPQIFLTERGGEIYLVNTEGFDYCRYVLRIPLPPPYAE